MGIGSFYCAFRHPLIILGVSDHRIATIMVFHAGGNAAEFFCAAIKTTSDFISGNHDCPQVSLDPTLLRPRSVQTSEIATLAGHLQQRENRNRLRLTVRLRAGTTIRDFFPTHGQETRALSRQSRQRVIVKPWVTIHASVIGRNWTLVQLTQLRSSPRATVIGDEANQKNAR
jgi:hypothetical protein